MNCLYCGLLLSTFSFGTVVFRGVHATALLKYPCIKRSTQTLRRFSNRQLHCTYRTLSSDALTNENGGRSTRKNNLYEANEKEIITLLKGMRNLNST